MIIYLMILVGSVFLGTEVLAIPTPFAQITIYRLLALGVLPLVVYQLMHKNRQLSLVAHSHATYALGVFVLWGLWGFASLAWAQSLTNWAQAMFLLTVGISSVIAIYFWVNDLTQWKKLIQVAWIFMSFLVVWGYFEIITNQYFFANLGKLDKHGTFSSQPFTRIPITTFSNQNDYATMLLAYLTVCLILFFLTNKNWQRIMYIAMFFLASYLVYRSGSRMALLCLILLIGLNFLLNFHWQLKVTHFRWGLLLVIGAGILIVLLKPSLFNHTIQTLVQIQDGSRLTGDEARINLWHNGIIFLVTTLGLGVGSGNIEYWMANYRIIPTNDLINIHNWWLDILVGYGIIVFALYVLVYGLLAVRLHQLMRSQREQIRHIARAIFSFVVIFIIASITSSSNMLIEWHWVFFGLIISFIKIMDLSLQKRTFQQKITIDLKKTNLNLR